MRLSSLTTGVGIFLVAGALSVVAAAFSVRLIESASLSGVLNELDREDMTWAEVDVNGLQVFLIGTAPDEAERFRALSVAGRIVDAARVIDQMLVEEPEDIAPPRFSMEILRNDAGVSVIGLVPQSTDRADLVDQFSDFAADGAVTDLLEAADFPAPDGWDAAVRFATEALRELPRSQISVDAERVAIKAMADSAEAQRRLETALARRKPEDLRLALDLSAPRPVISPFAMRFVIEGGMPRFDSCSADTEAARDKILSAAAQAGLAGKVECRLGLGTPSRRWGDAVNLAISKLAELEGSSVTFTNADITLVAPEGTAEAVFDRVVGELEAGLPDVFALKAILPKPKVVTEDGPPEFIVTLSPEGAVQLRGKLASEAARTTADSYARARFGSEVVYTAARVSEEDLPRDWSVRSLAALEVLSMLVNGGVTVTPDSVVVTGKTGNKDAAAQITALLTTKLGEEDDFDIRVQYVETLDPTLGLPTPEECEARIVQTIGDRKITFEPGSATLDRSAEDIMDALADLLKQCGDIPLEISGHTDSQGRESMNQDLSQKRAQAVLDALRQRRVPVKDYTVKGYGEGKPISDNGTPEGREANRRIEFRLLKPEPDPDAADAADGDAAAADAAKDGDAPAEGPADE